MAAVYNRSLLYVTVDLMHEVRVESLEKLESLGGEVWISANSGSLSLVFSRVVWEEILSREIPCRAPEPTEAELSELEALEGHLRGLSPEESEDPGSDYDLVLKPRELYAVTTGYLFRPVVEAPVVERVQDALGEDDFVEQAYVIGAVADESALAAGDENVKVVSVRGGKSSTSRFEMSPELWRTLSGKLRWNGVQTIISQDANKG